MRKLILILSALMLSAVSACASVTDTEYVKPDNSLRYTVKDDGGGDLEQFQSTVNYLSANNIKIRLDGYCASSCTLVLNKEKHIDVCVTPNAVIMVHQPYIVQPTEDDDSAVRYKLTDITDAEQSWKVDFLAVYPDWLKELIKKHGGVPSVYTTGDRNDTYDLDITVLSKYLPVCQ